MRKKLSISEAIRDESLRMTNKDLFTSAAFEQEMTRLARNIVKKYDIERPIEVRCVYDDSEGAFIAATNGYIITVNIGNFFIRQYKSKEAIYRVVRILILHECGHILYTDFDTEKVLLTKLARGTGLTKSGCMTDYMREKVDEANEYIGTLKSARIRIAVGNIIHDVNNILEDGYVDAAMMREFPGFAGDFRSVLDIQYDDRPSLTSLLEKEKENETAGRLNTVLSLMLSYALFAEYNCEEWQEASEAVRTVNELEEFIDWTIEERDGEKRVYLEEAVFAMILPVVKPYIEEMIEKYGNEEEAAEGMERRREAAKSSSSAAAPSGVSTSSAARRPKEAEEAEEPEEPGDAEKAKADEGLEDAEAGDEPKESKDTGMETPSGAGAEEEPGSEEDGTPVDAPRLLGDGHTPAPRTPYSSTKEEDTSETEAAQNEKAAEEIERILEKAARTKGLEAAERAKREELKAEAAAVKHSAIHNGVRCKIIREASVDDGLVRQYNQAARPLEDIARRISREVNKILTFRKGGSVQHNLYLGRRLDAGALARHDGRVMSRRKLPQRHPTLAVALRCDESGSMSLNDRIAYVRAAAIIMWNFCHEVGIPIAIYGDDETSTVNIRSYAEFDNPDGMDKYRIMDMSARANNRDGYAIRFVAERLAKRKEDVKILFVISDGEPYASGYYGMTAQEDMRSIVEEYQKKGIVTIAAAIGDDKDAIEQIYGEDRFLDIEDLEKLPETLVNVLRRYIKA